MRFERVKIIRLFKMSKQERNWFKAIKYGWGWTPSTWEGWSVIGIYLAFVLFYIYSVESVSIIGSLESSFMPILIIATFILIVICYIKGEKPHF